MSDLCGGAGPLPLPTTHSVTWMGGWEGERKRASTVSARADQNDTFASAAARLAGVAGALLGWPPGVFWAATPAELACVIRALAGDDAAAAEPPDAGTIRRLMEEHPDG